MTAGRKLRVVTLIDRPITTGGGEKLASVVAMGLDPDRFDRILCSSRSAPAATFESELRAAGVRVLVLDRGSPFNVTAWHPLLRLLREERVDILHTHKFGSNVWGTLIGRLARVPVIVAHEHSWSYEGNRLRRFLDREVVGRGASAFVAVSREDERRMIAVEGVDPRVIRFIPNGVPPQVPRGTDVRAELGIDAEAPVVGVVAQLRPEKALDVLLDAARGLRDRYPTLTVLIAGDGPEEAGLRELVRERGLADTVRLIGRRTDVPDVLAALDVAVNCSDSEGSPLSVIEYMAAGLAIVATRIGGVPDLVEDGSDGVLVPPRDPAALAEAVAALIEDPGLRERLGASARAKQQREFAVDVMLRRIEDLYEELFGATARARDEGWVPIDRSV